jgi:hypothetical protein
MGTESGALPRQTGAISTALIAMAGFTAGALLMGLLAFTRHPMPPVAETVAVPISSTASGEQTKAIGALNRDSTQPGQADEALTWPFESATPAHEGIPGPRRPDRLSAPDGWTYDLRAERRRSD